jgi:hypothetical protein
MFFVTHFGTVKKEKRRLQLSGICLQFQKGPSEAASTAIGMEGYDAICFAI